MHTQIHAVSCTHAPCKRARKKAFQSCTHTRAHTRTCALPRTIHSHARTPTRTQIRSRARTHFLIQRYTDVYCSVRCDIAFGAFSLLLVCLGSDQIMHAHWGTSLLASWGTPLLSTGKMPLLLPGELPCFLPGELPSFLPGEFTYSFPSSLACTSRQ